MVSIGAQWVVLQSAAWVGMAVSYSITEGSVKEGLSKTFDGQHPCALCKVVNKGQETDKKSPTEAAGKLIKLDLFCEPVTTLALRCKDAGRALIETQTGDRRLQTPPVPPPRGEATAV